MTSNQGRKGWKHAWKTAGKQPCGAYNYTGCMQSAETCGFSHEYSLLAGTKYYQSLTGQEQAEKGLKLNSRWPKEFQNLRMRNLNSLNQTEQLAYLQLPLEDSSKSSTTTAPVESKKRKRARLKASIDSKVEAPLLVESEVQEPMPTKQEREAFLREEAEQALLERMLAATEIACKAKPMRNVTEAERQAIVDEVDAILNLQLAALEEEFAQIADPVMNHRFGLVASGELGVYRPGSECNTSNKRHMAVLLRNLNEMLKDANGRDEQDEAAGYYACRFCVRSLYRSEARRKRVICACLRCISVLYCSDWCRFNDAKDHKFSCYLHPAWESPEGTKQRCGRAKSGVKAPADAEVPTIEATDDPKKGGQEASNDAQPEGAPPQDGEVQGDGEKTAGNGGESDA